MSYTYFISSKKELPLGQFGVNKKVSATKTTKVTLFLEGETSIDSALKKIQFDISNITSDEIDVYNTIEDISGLVISKLNEYNKMVEKHFENEYVYHIHPNFGSNFFLNHKSKIYDPLSYRGDKKTIENLFEFIKENIDKGGPMEMYTCWIGEEARNRDEKLDKVIKLSEFVLGNNFSIEDRQYVRFIK